MPLLSLSQTYHIAPKRDVAPAQAPLATPKVDPDARGRRDQHAERDPGQNRHPDEPRECDSVQRSPLLQALKLALGPAPTASVKDEVTLERALIAFARALNQATHDADAAPQPAAVRADDVARRRAHNEEQLLASFAALQQAAGRSVTSLQALQQLLDEFLEQLTRQLKVDQQHAGDVTQPGSLINIRA